jgi:2-amino-4-hydroxy-6-hydroxymethyldihydropteridine diphosphokinase
MSVQRGFLLGIGSNIKPEFHIVKIIEQLLSEFPSLNLSRVLHIPPVGMNTHNDFLNLVIFIETDLSEQQLKAICNRIELGLGRDRTDPERKVKDRCADLDILSAISLPTDANKSPSEITDEYFLYPLIDELIGHLTNTPNAPSQTGVALSTLGLTFGEAAATINRNTCTGHKRVI